MIKDTLLLFWHPIERYGPRIPELVITLVIGIVAIKVASMLFAKVLKVAKFPKTLSSIISTVATIVLWVLFFSEILRQAGMSNLALTLSGSAVVVGLILANSVAPVIADIASGLYLAKDPDFEVGYRIKFADFDGVIRKIDIRKVRIRDDSGKLHVVPNSLVDKSSWIVLSRDTEANLIDKPIRKKVK